MESWKRMLLANQAWVAEMKGVNPNFFEELAREQKPEFLWIGCSDSRVPAEEITGMAPGDLFVHRNVANLVIHTDLNLLAVLQFAVDHLKVKHVIVCGHHGCGGVKAALGHQHYGLMSQWIRQIKDTWHTHEDDLAGCDTPEKKLAAMVEINVKTQVNNLLKTSIIQNAWKREQRPTLHGWVYDLHDGLLRPLVQLQPGAAIPDAYRYDFDASKG